MITSLIYILSEQKVPLHCIFSYFLLVITFCKHCSSGYCPQEGNGVWSLHMGTVGHLERENTDSPWPISHHYVHDAITHENEIDRKILFFLNLSCGRWQLITLDPFLLCTTYTLLTKLVLSSEGVGVEQGDVEGKVFIPSLLVWKLDALVHNHRIAKRRGKGRKIDIVS